MIEHWDRSSEIRRVTFISDLHLMSARSNAETHRNLIARCIAGSDLCVWGGDLFDFRWSRLASNDQSIGSAIDWLDHWYQRFPNVRFVYLNGNHDAHLSFRRQLFDWTAARDRFTSGIECLRIGDTLWLHGDVIEGDGSADAFTRYRGRWQDKPIAGKMASRFYDVAVTARVHKAAALAAHRRRSTCLRLVRWVHREFDDQASDIRRIVFGHTHRRIDSFRVADVEFHNGGAAIKHVPFQPVCLELP